MAKRFYEKSEFVWIKPLQKKGRVKELDIKNLSATITHFTAERELTEEVFKFEDIDKLREKTKEQESKRDTVLFAKVDERAVVPSKRHEDGCYDVYAIPNVNNDGDYVINPHEIVSIRTGIASSLLPKYRFDIKRERGSSGSLGLVPRCGQVDSGYRGEWFIKMQNTTIRPIVITSRVSEVKHFVDHVEYPMSKAICQAALELVPDVATKEISYDDLKKIPSERGETKLGQSGK